MPEGNLLPSRPLHPSSHGLPCPLQPVLAPNNLLRMRPPARFDDATFASYEATTSSQRQALEAVQAFAGELRESPSLAGRVRRAVGLRPAPERQGLYLVGPAGTGKTHLLAATCHALTPAVSCAFLHSSDLFRTAEHPERMAQRLAQKARLLCLDEVELDDAANEARLVLFLKTLEQEGVRLLATSNVEPEKFLSRSVSRDRFRRFLTEEFREQYDVIVVTGEDYRRGQAEGARPGRGWIGPAAEAALRRAYERNGHRARWLPFGDLLAAATDTAHEKLLRQLRAYDRLYIPGITLRSTDDALRLLRLVDDLYTDPEAPALYFSAEAPPERWFAADDVRQGVERGIAEKFTRTVSRLHALCEIETVSEQQDPAQRAAAHDAAGR